MAICALPVVPAPPTTRPTMPFVSLVAAITTVDGAPVSFASLLTVVPVVVSLAISNSVAFVVPRSRFPPSAPDSVGVVMVGLVARTTLPVPVVALPVGVPVIVGLEIVGVDSVGAGMVGLVANTILPVPVVALPAGVPLKEGLDIDGAEMVGLVARTTLPVPVVALPVGVPVIVGFEIVGLEIVGLEMVGVVMVGLVARTTAPEPVVPLDRSAAAAGIPTFSLGKMLMARGVALIPFVDSTNPRICPEPGRVLPAS